MSHATTAGRYDTIDLMIERIEIVAKPEHRRMRLEDMLLDHFDTVSKMYLRKLVKTGECEVNGRDENVGYRLRANDFIEINVDHTRGTAMRGEDIAIEILHEESDIIVVIKAHGMLMHPSHRDNSGTLLNALVAHVNWEKGKKGEREKGRSEDSPLLPNSPYPLIRPGLIHRLDKETSGIVIVAKNPRAHRILSGQFMKKTVEKRYQALVMGEVIDDRGKIIAPIGRFEEEKQWGVKDDGKYAETNYWVTGRRDGKTLLELEPVTGRTNQLRIHCQHIGHPIVGDTKRGGGDASRLCLHACKLAFNHPTTRERMTFESKIEF